MRIMKVKGESTVKGSKCTTEKIRLQPRTVTGVEFCPFWEQRKMGRLVGIWTV